MSWKQRKPKKPVYSKEVVQGWIKRMGDEKISANKLAVMENVAPTTVNNKLAAYYAGELD